MKNPLPKEVYLNRTRKINPEIRGDYFRDQTAIIHSMPFRRLKHKTQVFFSPKNDHVCTRIEHVMHVATIAKTICLGLNKYGYELDTEAAFAIGLGHDLGHAPFGHEGEYILNKKLGSSHNFIHEINSYRIVEYLAKNGKGLNLSYIVKDGIISHNGEKFEQYLKPDKNIKNFDKIINRKIIPSSYEGCVVRFADKIAYLGRDIEDAITANFIKRNDIPEDVKRKLGNSNSKIINGLTMDFINNSKENEKIGFSDEKYDLLLQLYRFNYKNIYLNKKLRAYKKQAVIIINTIFDYLLELFDKIGKNYNKYRKQNLKLDRTFGKYIERMHEFYKTEKQSKVIVCDYIAGMTDLYVLNAIKQLTIPAPVF